MGSNTAGIIYFHFDFFAPPPRSEQVSGAHVNEIKHDHSPVVIVVLDPRYTALYIYSRSITFKRPDCNYTPIECHWLSQISFLLFHYVYFFFLIRHYIFALHMSVGISVSLILVQLIPYELFALEASNLVYSQQKI